MFGHHSEAASWLGSCSLEPPLSVGLDSCDYHDDHHYYYELLIHQDIKSDARFELSSGEFARAKEAARNGITSLSLSHWYRELATFCGSLLI